jgi:hypothetical protein
MATLVMQAPAGAVPLDDGQVPVPGATSWAAAALQVKMGWLDADVKADKIALEVFNTKPTVALECVAMSALRILYTINHSPAQQRENPCVVDIHVYAFDDAKGVIG